MEAARVARGAGSDLGSYPEPAATGAAASGLALKARTRPKTKKNSKETLEVLKRSGRDSNPRPHA